MYPRPHPSRDEVEYLQKRLQQSHTRLLTHPALTSSLSVRDVKMFPPEAPKLMLKQLFNQLVRRELKVDPEDPNSLHACRSILDKTRAAASEPSLSAPSFVTSLSSGFDSSSLSNKSVLTPVAPAPLYPVNSSPSAEALHQLLKQRREERARARARAEKAAAEEAARLKQLGETNKAKQRSTPEALKQTLKSTDKVDNVVPNKLHQTLGEQHNSQNTEDNDDANDDNDGPTRRTRSATRRAHTDEFGRVVPPTCCFCPSKSVTDALSSSSPNDAKSNELLGPFANPKSPTGVGLYVHFECACWAPQVFTDSATNQLRRVYEEHCRGRQLRCAHCQERGATVGCYVQRCNKVFHFRCLGPGGAHRVERFFVAFCEKHSHLAEQETYKTLMNAATIADVAATYRKDNDATHGLDAPHSRFTKLRRSQVELIFSSRLGITSVPSVFDVSHVVFSHRRRTIVQRNERLSVSDGLRTIRMSALDVASGRLAYMAVVKEQNASTQMSAVDARAAIASPDNARIFLLRNFRHAPRWSKQQLQVVRNATSGKSGTNNLDSRGTRQNQRGRRPRRRRGQSGNEEGDVQDDENESDEHAKNEKQDELQPRSDLDPSFFSGCYDGDGVPLLIVSPPGKKGGSKTGNSQLNEEGNVNANDKTAVIEAEGSNDDNANSKGNNSLSENDDQTTSKKRRGRPPKRLRSKNSSSSDENANQPVAEGEEVSRPLPKSSLLPALKRMKRSSSGDEIKGKQKDIADSPVNDVAKACNDVIAAAAAAAQIAGVQSIDLMSAPMKRPPKENESAQKRDTVIIRQDVGGSERGEEDRDSSSPSYNVGLKGKVKSAWETFLAESLPKERNLRPDDSMQESMRNMARLWSLMTVAERDAYEARARAAAVLGASADGEGDNNDRNTSGKGSGLRRGATGNKNRDDGDQTLQAYLEQSRRRGRHGVSHVSAREAGLFLSGGASVTKKSPHTTGASTSKRQGSVSLPRFNRKSRTSGRHTSSRNESVDLDEMFPEFDIAACSDMEEDDDDDNDDDDDDIFAHGDDDDDEIIARGSIRPPPPRRRRP